MTDLPTLFFFVSRVARLREAQRRYDEVGSQYNHRQMVPLAHEVDALLVRAQKTRLYPDFLAFVTLVGNMRQAQGLFGLVADAERLKLEIAVDKLVEYHTGDAKFLNTQLQKHNVALDVPVTANNRRKRGGK